MGSREHPFICVLTWSLLFFFAEREREKMLFGVSSHIYTRLSNQGPTLKLAFNHNFFLTLNTAKMGVKASAYAFGVTHTFSP